MPTFEYYLSKINEFNARVRYLRSQFALLTDDSHPILINEIANILTQCDSEIKNAERILATGHQSYLPRLREIYLGVYAGLEKVNTFYIWPLLTERQEEKQVYHLINKACQECGYPSIKDSLTKLGHRFPAVILFNLECPIFHFPSDIGNSIRWWPVIFHEIGHLLARLYRDSILKVLIGLVQQHFTDATLAGSHLSSSARNALSISIQRSLRYWIDRELRVEEVFCDCFAVYMCGLSYVYTWIDIAIALDERPKELKIADPHLPTAARFYICWKTLPVNLQNSNIGREIYALWEAYEKKSRPAANLDSKLVEYDIACSDDLITKLADECIKVISSLPNVGRRCEDSPRSIDADSIQKINLVDVVNCFTYLSIKSPSELENFQSWATTKYHLDKG
jgi:hypothetical protein